MTTLKSRLGRANWKGVWGWALDAASPQTRQTIEIVIDDEVIGRVVARDPRPQLKIFAPEYRDCGFQFLFPNGLSALSRHVVRARLASDGTELEDSPVILEPEPGFDPALERTLDNALQVAAATAQSQAEVDAPLAFVAAEIAKLVAAREAVGGGREPLPPALAGLTERWSEVAERLAQGRASFPESNEEAAGPARRMLVIGDAMEVLDSSGRALMEQIASLRRLRAEVDFVAADYRPSVRTQVAAAEALGATYLRPPLSLSVEDVLLRNRGLYEAVLIHRVTNFEKYAALVRHYCPLARLVFSVDSLFFVAMARRAAVQQWEAGEQKAGALRLREMMSAWESHAVITHSAFEAELLRRGVPQGNVHVVGLPAEVRPGRPDFAARSGVAFVGDFQQFADLDAAAWLAEALVPAIQAGDAAIPCLIAGCNMPEILRGFSREGVEIIEERSGSPIALSPVLDRARVVVAPFRASAGLPELVLASMAAGIPCIGSRTALEAFDLPESLQGCVAEEIAEMAASVRRLHEDEAEHARLSAAGLAFVAQRFSPGAVDAQMRDVVGVVAAAPRVSSPSPSGRGPG